MLSDKIYQEVGTTDPESLMSDSEPLPRTHTIVRRAKHASIYTNTYMYTFGSTRTNELYASACEVEGAPRL